MLSINGLHNFYYLPELHDMRCKAQRICEIIRGRYHRDPLNGDVYMFMSKDRRKVRMIHYERNAYYLHEKSFIKGYKFMKIERKDDVTVYKIDWKDLVTILETPIITSIRI
ncbi:MAG: IS66 family insertion sequence element accessory protein TnpB [Phocaeicola coprophilus]|uniref:IS66 family insertion sequence element accessory protein TnpB n=1 Tax=Phocaeicola coprophilus TaxID=387090 RepID=UPI003991E8E7